VPLYRFVVIVVSLIVLGVVGIQPGRAQPSNPTLILSTTTSTQDSGLLDELVPFFERQSGYSVKTVAVGTGQALALGARGEADVLLVHAPEIEKQWMAEGNGADRRLVMYNDFVVIGPSSDPAQISAASTAPEVMQRIAAAGATFIGRGDNSGTHVLELQLWRAAGLDPHRQPWYLESGQGMGQTLTLANDKLAYTLTDRGTFLARQATLDLAVLVEGYPTFLNVYHVITVAPDRSPMINTEGARAFADFVVAAETQQLVGQFGVARFGQPLFFPAAHLTDERLGV
jgi:tungstate transport system substrate-binding protein